MDAPKCPACDKTFNDADELFHHQAGDSCATDMSLEVGLDQNTPPIPVIAATPELPSSADGTQEGSSQAGGLYPTSETTADASQSTPQPLEAGTPDLGSQVEAEKDESEDPLDSTQDIINHIAANNVATRPPGPQTRTAAESKSTQHEANTKSEDAKDDEEYHKILAGFCVDAPTEDIKACLRRYKVDKTYKQLKSVFNADRKPVIIQTIQHLGCNDTNLEVLSKADCIHKLICIIQSLLPEECGVCNETYVVQKNDPPLLSCKIMSPRSPSQMLQSSSLQHQCCCTATDVEHTWVHISVSLLHRG